MTAEILGLGAHIPENVITNDELAKTVDTSDEWIRSHTGIGKRHIIAEDKTTSDMAVEAAKIAIERAGIDKEEIDMIIVASASGDYSTFPSTACVVQHKLEIRHTAAMDLAAGCTGFVYGVEVARSMILSGSVKKALVIGVEALSRITNWKDRDTCVLFGDGAGAVVMGKNKSGDGRGILDYFLGAEGDGYMHLMRKAGGAKHPFHCEDTPEKDLYISMNGRRVYGFAVRVNETIINTLLDRNSLTVDDLHKIIPHQANIRIIQAAAKRLSIPMEKFFVVIEEYANTSAASIPIALNAMQERGELNKGDLILTSGFGAGLTYGGNLIRW
ncbi:MAG: ketoacyl-ACP synthase III [Spirochaetales bacterium]|uniref:Beta-ketoacyl-[acyl-carrier-protein] synthase III n=1 Tax=Candidatus Thalassospirochaeta sargassi TaxID=3119039 RepID=A0AAJ1IFS1_9SPIO|nr:ketoacyl-ACP synthase III [Spirochaetales bacterium]